MKKKLLTIAGVFLFVVQSSGSYLSENLSVTPDAFANDLHFFCDWSVDLHESPKNDMVQPYASFQLRLLYAGAYHSYQVFNKNVYSDDSNLTVVGEDVDGNYIYHGSYRTDLYLTGYNVEYFNISDLQFVCVHLLGEDRDGLAMVSINDLGWVNDSSVPEPAIMSFSVIGLLCLAGFKIRRK